MIQRIVCVVLLAVGAGVDAADAAAPSGETGQRGPNVVVILADDQGWGDLSHSGNPQIETPRIDSLARQGASFEHFYVQPVCSPTRAEFLTGRYHPRCGVRGVSTGGERMDLDEKTIADAFRAAGYATGAFGKWHNGSQWPYHPNARGFDEYYGFTSGHWGEYFDAPLEHNGRAVRGRGYIADDFTEHAIEFIGRHRDEPLFCYLAFNTPHSPFIVPREDWERFRDRPIVARGPDGERETIEVTRAALAMCENIDRNVGRLLDALDRWGIAERTIVVYFSDNGPNSFRFNGGMKGRKGSTDEGGVRSMCFVRWPGRIAPGTVIPQIAGAIDLLPTLCGLAGVARVGNKPLDGVDLSPLLLGRGTDWPRRKIFAHWNRRVSVRTDRYRLDADGRLFDMVTDPGQQTDIRDRQAEVAADLAAAVAAWRREMRAESGAAHVDPPNRALANAALLPPDDRPFTIGYREFPRTVLPARDGKPSGGIRRSAAAPNCSYFVHWRTTEDEIAWDVEVATTGLYEVEILYTCPEADAGSTVEMSFGGQRVSGRVEPPWDPPLVTDQDVIPRPSGESIMKEFRPLRLGTIRLEAGRGALRLRALDIPGRSVMDVRAVVLTLLDPTQPPAAPAPTTGRAEPAARPPAVGAPTAMEAFVSNAADDTPRTAAESRADGTAHSGGPPNILLILTDDQSFETLGALGRLDIRTPNLDRLASLGTTFTRAYNMGSWTGAVCIASRTMLVTGRSLWRAEALYRRTDAERQASRLWPQLMARAGYRTYFTGKWHVKTDAAKVFDATGHIRAGMPKDSAQYNRPAADGSDPWDPTDPSFGGHWEGGRHWSEVTADEAIEHLRQVEGEASPIFMYVAFNAPHDPRQSPQRFLDMYPLDRVDVPRNFLPEYPYKDLIGCSAGLRDERLGPFPRTEHAVRVHRREYYAIISHLDEQIGRILDALERSGRKDRTWVFLTSDQGLAVGHHGLFGKQNMYEHSLRVPLVVVGPGVAKGRRIDVPVYLQDIMPTALELAGVDKPDWVEFHSLLPLLRSDRPQTAYPAIYGAYLGFQRAVIEDQWKLIVYPEAGVKRLYHLAEDPDEMHDLAGDPAHAARVERLTERLKQLQRQFDDRLDLDAPPASQPAASRSPSQ